MNTSEQDRLALASEIEAIIRRHVWAKASPEGATAQMLGFGAAAAEIANLRAPAATDTAGEVERMRERCARVCDDDAAETRALEKASLSRATKDRWRTATLTAAGIAKKIRAIPLTPDDPAAGDGGGR